MNTGLLQNTLLLELGDALKAIAKERLQDVTVVATEGRRSAFDAHWRPREGELRPFDRGGAVDRAFELDEVAAMGQLGIALQIIAILYRTGWNATRLEQRRARVRSCIIAYEENRVRSCIIVERS